jgi:Lrp/AsnC family leucine-responsive transcriptional regulator
MTEIVECYRGTGVDSFIMKLHVISVEHLNHVIDCLTPYGTTSTSVVLGAVVEKSQLGPENLEWPVKSKSSS